MSTEREFNTRQPNQCIDFSCREYDCHCNNREEHQSRSILRAVWDSDLETLQMLLSGGIQFDINYRGRTIAENEQLGKTYNEQFDHVLLDDGIMEGYTPLQAAVSKQFTAGMKILIENNADVNSIVPKGYLTPPGQCALSIVLSHNMRIYHRSDETVRQVRMLLEAGAYATDIIRYLNIVARMPHGSDRQNLAVLELVFASMTDEDLWCIMPMISQGVVDNWRHWSDEAIELLRLHQERRVRIAEEKNMTFALSLHPRAVRNGAISSQLDKDIAWKIMEHVCSKRPATGRR